MYIMQRKLILTWDLKEEKEELYLKCESFYCFSKINDKRKHPVKFKINFKREGNIII